MQYTGDNYREEGYEGSVICSGAMGLITAALGIVISLIAHI